MEKLGGRFLDELRGEVHNFSYTALMFAVMIVVTSCQISRQKCTKFDFGWGSAPDPTGGAYSAPPDSLAEFKRPTSKGEREGMGRGKEGREKGTCSTILGGIVLFQFYT